MGRPKRRSSRSKPARSQNEKEEKVVVSEEDKIEASEEKDVAKDDGQGIPNPVVLQCGSCKNIIGDTLSLAFIDPELKLVSLRDVSDFVSVGGAKTTSKEGFDKGCKWLELKCKNCNAFLGKKIVEVDPGANLSSELLDVFTFHDDDIATYQVGSLRRPVVENEDIHEKGVKPAKIPIESSGLSEKMASVISKNKNDISMVKYTIIGLMDRIRELEEKLGGMNSFG
mmetsp:Transcript_18008/g.20344  ORF Transcript_18008/g.20344 Transcript_18008/m.20344 type:complete len:226 (-) Transcript_18008:84-761(-)|eukprot:CAMPEP_0204850520 /NCGR_PEP_ID=MMETSP1347-20130617/8301_1 /ASSEMBLY_ACC=CAM_ASM_000690 /TAXON_ID=215587 /ORGANISM="Aplanochytrium stocchinoi, Strain GSBS06" /LENGTH=225 /DNA_ID=CAMNT_0051993549 /DNA_START=31 /DNA_END=708 /DNA_ORIENTATION=+